ncbi:beta-2 adrenergic receptor-like [Orbicella faveolata]|uniref:beta-2 adrenergic receptor-like n=1 Tax=Orbicella faveolata TaxID=48498 RepID=UPI0009E2507D|nr:beta-2 adrenergic receptor-like [Orbicella faveolata]
MNISCGFNERLNSAASIVLSLWFASSGLAAVIGNAVVLWLFYKNQSLRTISNRFLASLCVADFLAGLVVHPMFIAIRVFAQPQRGNILLDVIHMVWIHSTAATVFNLSCVSVDRFIAIRFPFRYQDIITKQRCCAVIIIVWLISLFLPFSWILVNATTAEEFWFSLSFIFFKLPITVVTLCYIWIFTVARKQASRIKTENLQNSNEMNTPVRVIKNYKAIKTIGFVLGVFFVSWMPSLVVSVVEYVTANDKCFRDKLLYVVRPWIVAVGLTSSAINPWIYYFRNEEFREALRRCFHWFPLNVTPEFPLERNRNQRM